MKEEGERESHSWDESSYDMDDKYRNGDELEFDSLLSHQPSERVREKSDIDIHERNFQLLDVSNNKGTSLPAILGSTCRASFLVLAVDTFHKQMKELKEQAHQALADYPLTYKIVELSHGRPTRKISTHQVETSGKIHRPSDPPNLYPSYR